MKSSYGVETVDQISREDWPDYKEFKKELRSMLENYHLAGMSVYTSQICTNDWKNN
jgi:hypothetical protein